MNGIVDALRALILEAAAIAGPTVVSAGLGAAAGGLSALVLALLTVAIVRRWRRRTVRVSSLAARGASRAEIARRTGMSQDAVGMLLHVRSGRRGRRNLPLPARIAVPRRDPAHRANRDLKLEVFAVRGDRSGGPRPARSARPLPFATLTANRLTRSGRAA